MKVFRFALALIALFVSALIIFPLGNCPQEAETGQTACLQRQFEVLQVEKANPLEAIQTEVISTETDEGANAEGNGCQPVTKSKCPPRPVKDALEHIKSDKMVKGDFFQNGVFGSSGEALEVMGTTQTNPCCDS